MKPLTKSQHQALDLIASGNLSKEAAQAMGVSVRTIESHLSSARKSLGAKTTAQAVAMAIRLNIIRSLLIVTLLNAVSLNFSMDIRQPARTRTTQTTRTVARNLQVKTGRQKA